MSKIEKNCNYCGNVFYVHPYRKDAKYCSRDCIYKDRVKNNKLIKTCIICKKKFSGPSYLIKRQKYCSYECSAKGYSKYHTNDEIFKTCKCCGKKISSKLKSNFHNIECCSQQCAGKLKSKRSKDTKICGFCGKEFTNYKKYVKKRTYCSNQCRASAKAALKIPYINCKYCGKEFKRREKRSKYCSIECGLKGTASPYSKWCKELASKIHEHVDIRSSEFGGEAKFLNKNNRHYFVDICYGNKVIECYGDYWHAHEKLIEANHKFKFDPYKKRKEDKERISYLKEEHGLDILIVWEYNYKQDSDSILNTCIKFLNGENN